MTNDSSPNARSWFVWIVAIGMAVFSSGLHVRFFELHPGIDFYHFWGIAAARSFGEEELGTPYANAPRYAAILNQRADASDDKHFKGANALRRTIDPTGTPLFYASFAWMPKDYSTAHMLFRFAQFAAASIAMAWIGLQLGLAAGVAWLFAFTALTVFYPFQIDLMVGNVNTLQLLGCAALARLATRLERERGLALGSVFASALVAFVLYKPNLAPISGLLALFAWSVLGLRRFAASIAIALGVGLVLVALSSWYFGTWHAWSEWSEFLRGANSSKLADYSVRDGNWAPSVVFVDRATHPNYAELTYAASTWIGIGLALTWLAAAWIGKRGANFAAKLAELAADPQLMLSTALLFTLAASPLVWSHYCVLAVLPALWCTLLRPRFGVEAALGSLSLFLYGCLVSPHIESFGVAGLDYKPQLLALAWIPMWLVVLLEVARDRSAAKV